MMEQARVVVSDNQIGGEKVWLMGGLARGEGKLTTGSDGVLLHVSRGDALRLGIRPRQQVSFWQAGDALQLGPYIGIMTNKRPRGTKGFQGLRGRRETYVALLKMARSMGSVAYVFACEDVDFKRMRVIGYHQSKAGNWLAHEYPLPNVVYNRIPDRQSEVAQVVRMAKKRFEQLAHSHRTAIFNPHFLNKWDLHRIFSQEPGLRRYLLDTKLYHGPEDVLSMLKRHRMVYLKPRDTFAGHGIMRAEYKGGKYILIYKVGGTYRHEPHENFRGLAQSFSARRHPGIYLVQQGLRLAKYKGAIFDARIIMQKTGEGVWDLTGAGVRVAARGGITTHVPNGGYIAPIETVISDVFHERLDTPGGVYTKLRNLALTVAPAIENHYKRLFGELSMDIGITSDGECYFFEANAKPMKFDEPIIRRKSLRRLVEFSRYLSGYQRHEVDDHVDY
ncbi:MAG: hypothetical protein FD169_108 [Bacillota bacterium]|nr:MAG: hypothetical protein FD169_108 [Bacillota bacterium]